MGKEKAVKQCTDLSARETLAPVKSGGVEQTFHMKTEGAGLILEWAVQALTRKPTTDKRSESKGRPGGFL